MAARVGRSRCAARASGFRPSPAASPSATRTAPASTRRSRSSTGPPPPQTRARIAAAAPSLSPSSCSTTRRLSTIVPTRRYTRHARTRTPRSPISLPTTACAGLRRCHLAVSVFACVLGRAAPRGSQPRRSLPQRVPRQSVCERVPSTCAVCAPTLAPSPHTSVCGVPRLSHVPRTYLARSGRRAPLASLDGASCAPLGPCAATHCMISLCGRQGHRRPCRRQPLGSDRCRRRRIRHPRRSSSSGRPAAAPGAAARSPRR